MHQVTHDPQLVSRMVGERYAQADANRLAKLARGRRSPRPSLAGRINGQFAHLASIIRHRPVTPDAAPATRS